jgi:hypothetical protein
VVLEIGQETVVKWAAEGAVKCELSQSILQRFDTRQLSGICWYPESARLAVNQGGTADSSYSSLAELPFCRGFLFSQSSRRKI